MKTRHTEAQLREKLKKAPLWIQDLANQALRERDNALAELAQHYKSQKKTACYIEQFDVGGTTKTYIDTFGKDEIKVEHAGIELEIAWNSYGGRDGKGIEVRFNRAGQLSGGQVALVPKYSNVVELRLPENMR